MLLIIHFVIFVNTLYAQDFIPLNEHGIEIRDMDKYKTCFFRRLLVNTAQERHAIIYDTLYRIHAEEFTFFMSNRRPSGQVRINYNEKGDTLRVLSLDHMKQIKKYGYYEQGLKFAEFEYKGDSVMSGWEMTQTGQKVPSKIDSYRPQLKISSEKYTRFLMNNMKYPKECRRKGIEGTVLLFLNINSEGLLAGIDIMNPESVDLRLQYEAVRVMSRYPWGFYPAKDKSGKPIDSHLKQPIHFKF